MDDKTNDERGITMLPMSAIEINNGQLKGLPKNPRLIKNAKYDKLKESITNYPEMLAWRSLLVYPLDNGKYIIVGGNMRYRAMKELGHKEAPVFIIPKETPIEKIKAYTILDNNGFGEWDWDLLANEWDADMLDDWGLDLLVLEDIEEPENHDGALRNKPFTAKLTFETAELLQRFQEDFAEQLKDEFNCLISLSGENYENCESKQRFD